MAEPLTSNAGAAIEAIWRIESAKLIAGLTRIVRDVGLAEDLAQDALIAALEQWPATGIPRNRGAWLMATAKHRAIDAFRRGERLDRKHAEIARDRQLHDASAEAALEAAVEEDIGDDMLRLVFIACHPVLSTEARVALTLRLLGGLTTPEIARAFLVPEPTVAQRIVRAKRSKSSISFSTRATRRPRAMIGCARRFVKTRCGSAASLPNSYRANPKPTASSRSWKFKHRACARASGRAANRSCCSIKIARAGTGCSSNAVSPHSSAR
jgi:RNA polymerase sigma factor (sigma-70 family)